MSYFYWHYLISACAFGCPSGYDCHNGICWRGKFDYLFHGYKVHYNGRNNNFDHNFYPNILQIWHFYPNMANIAQAQTLIDFKRSKPQKRHATPTLNVVVFMIDVVTVLHGI